LLANQWLQRIGTRSCYLRCAGSTQPFKAIKTYAKRWKPARKEKPINFVNFAPKRRGVVLPRNVIPRLTRHGGHRHWARKPWQYQPNASKNVCRIFELEPKIVGIDGVTANLLGSDLVA